jgi:phage terminase large subunit
MSHKLLPKQIEFLKSTTKVVLYLGGIGSGKSYIASLKAMLGLTEGRHIIVLAQSYKSLKLVLFEEILQRLREYNIPFVLNKADMTIETHNGGKIFGFSADSIENLRGITADMAILDEAALYDEYVYKVTQGRLRRPGYKMQTFITTTPRGTDNWIFPISKRNKTHFIHQKTTENVFLPAGFYEQLLEDYSGDESLMRQELDASFEDFGDSSAVIQPTDLHKARNRIPFEPHADDQRIAGLDVARYGGDRSCIMLRHGDIIVDYLVWKDTSTVETEQRAVNFVVKHNVDCLVVDAAGLGAGVADHLKQTLKGVCEVVDYNGAYKAIHKDTKYGNARAESWFLMRNWLSSTGSLPTDPQFNELTSITYFINSKNKILLTSKEDLRKENIKSPDVGDALSLTFSRRVKKSAAKKTSNSSRSTQKKFIG